MGVQTWAVPDSYLNKAAMLRATLLVSLCVASALSASPKWRRSVDESNRFMVHGSPRLVGGEPAEPNQFPYQVSFQYKFGGHFCGGMVYDENHVITAAHCCTNSASQVKIVAGWLLLQIVDRFGIIFSNIIENVLLRRPPTEQQRRH